MGVPPDTAPIGSTEAYADAHRAAYVLAGRNLAEILGGLYIESSTGFTDGGARNFVDQVRADLVRTPIPGGQVMEETSLEDFRKENRVTMTVRFPWDDSFKLIMLKVADRLQKVETERYIPAKLVSPPREETRFDALIVRVPGEFKPNIDPKIFNEKGELVYGARSVALDILQLQGTAQFTNNAGKAQASLEAHGARHPLIINGTLHPGNTDVDISDSDANQVLGFNQKTNFLAKGRVFYVIG